MYVCMYVCVYYIIIQLWRFVIYIHRARDKYYYSGNEYCKIQPAEFTRFYWHSVLALDTSSLLALCGVPWPPLAS